MGLTVDLDAALDCGPLATQFLGELAGPVGDLAALVVPVDGDRLGGIAAGTDGIDAGAIAQAIGPLVERVLPLAGSLPGAGDLLGGIEGTIATLESLSSQDLGTRLQGVLDALRDAMLEPADDSPFALVLRLVDVLDQVPEAGLVKAALGPLIQRAAVGAAQGFPLLDLLRGGDGLVRLLGGLLCLATVLDEADRLGALTASRLDASRFERGLATLDASLAFGEQPLADFVAGIDVADPQQVDAALNALAAVAQALTALIEPVNAALGFGEATLVYLDLGRLQQEIDVARGWVRQADLDPLHRVVEQLAALVNPLFAIDLGTLPAQALDTLIDRVEAEIADIAAGIAAVDTAAFVAPLADGIATLTQPLTTINDTIASVTLTLRSALGSVRDAIEALPIGAIEQAIRQVLEPIADVLEAIAVLLAEIDAALQTAADATGAALTQVDALLDGFKQELDTLFGAARELLDGANLDAVVGTIAQNVAAFVQTMQQAQMKPYFDTAVSAIGSATDVVGAVPFGLLPESMKADVDAAVKPIKDTDVGAFETEVESALGITPEGRFALRADLEAAIDDLQRRFQSLIDAVDARDPRELLADVDDALASLAEQVRTLVPDLTLEPVQQAIDALKGVLAAIDLDALLAPLDEAFQSIDDALDAYKPSRLVAPLQSRLDDARTALTDALQLDRWAQMLDDLQASALELLDQADPMRLEPLLAGAMQEALDLLERFPTLSTATPFGGIVATLAGGTGLRMNGSRFVDIAAWVGGASAQAQLAGHAGAFAGALQRTRDAVRALDVQASVSPRLGRLAALRQAAQGLATRLDAAAPQRGRLDAIVPSLDAGARLATLSGNRTRYLGLLDAACGLAEDFRRTGFSEADAGVDALRGLLAPLAPAGQTMRRVFAAAGIQPGELSVAGVVRASLAAVPPERLAALGTPVFDAVRGRIRALLDAVVLPLKDALAAIRALIDAIDLGPLAADADAVVAEVKAQIDSLSPRQLLQQPLAAFAALEQQVAADDPLAQVREIVANLEALVAGVLGKLDLQALLETPLAIYDDLLAALRRIDPQTLLEPVFDELDEIASQVDGGLDDTVTAFRRLQDALPGGGGGSSVSVSVG